MSRTVFVTSTPLHLIYSAAICETVDVAGPEIHWFGPRDAMDDAVRRVLGDLPVIDCTGYELNSFRGFVRGARRYEAEVVNAGAPVSRLYACYETHVAVDVIRHRFRIPWSSVGII